MARVVVGIGSHVEPRRHIHAGLDALKAKFGALRISRVFAGRPVGIALDGPVYNLVVTFESDVPVGELNAWCKHTERANGRTDHGPVTLDIDLLSVGQLRGCIDGVNLPSDDILRYAFVLRPLAELLPDERHPVTGERYDALWTRFDDRQQRLWPVAFIWRGRNLSP
jgi:2-amino-4-hydroxy-6-hydroxymethyldihydropteridine diphosphokinase